MKLIETIPAEVSATFPERVQKWVARGLATGPSDRPKMEAAVRRAYKSVGLKEPESFIWMESPYQGALAAWMLLQTLKNKEVWGQVRGQVRGQVGDQVRDQVWDQVWGQVGDQVWGQVRGQVWDQVRDQVWDQVRGQVWDQVGGQVGDQVRGQVWDQVGGQVGDQVRDQVWDQVWGQVRGQVRGQVGDQVRDQVWDQVWGQVGDQVWGQVRGQVWDQVRDQVWDQVRGQVGGQVGDQVLRNIVYGQWEAGWLSHVSTLIELGTRLDEDKKSWLDSMVELCDSGWWFPYEGMVVMCSRPDSLRRDPQGRLHNDHGPAISWKDGYELHYFHGTKVPKDIIEHPEAITVKAIMEETNSEVRRCMCEMMGWDQYVKEAKLKLIDECDDPANFPNKLRLFDVPDQVFSVPVRLLVMVNATPKRDGVVPLYGETVPKRCKTALEAAAWQVDVPVEMYVRMARAS